MISTETLLFGLTVISILTGLTTEGVKKLLTEHNKTYHANTLAAIVSTILSAAFGVGYVFVTDIAFSGKIVVGIIGLIFMSWLCAMVGYDKVIGAFKSTKE